MCICVYVSVYKTITGFMKFPQYVAFTKPLEAHDGIMKTSLYRGLVKTPLCRGASREASQSTFQFLLKKDQNVCMRVWSLRGFPKPPLYVNYAKPPKVSWRTPHICRKKYQNVYTSLCICAQKPLGFHEASFV